MDDVLEASIVRTMTDSDKERRDLSDRIGILEHLLLGSKHHRGWLQTVDAEIAGLRNGLEEQKTEVAKMHKSNEKRLRRIQNLGWLLAVICAAYGSFSGFKLSELADMMKVIATVVK